MAHHDATSSPRDDRSGKPRPHRIGRWRRRPTSIEAEIAASAEAAVATSGHRVRAMASTSSGARFVSRLLGPILDSRLATGRLPDSGPLVMARARWIISWQTRWNLADWWLDLVKQAREPAVPKDARVPVVRSRVLPVEPLIGELASALVAPLVTVRGVAMASSLLCDGAGPIYNPLSSVDLATSLREIIGRLDPTT